LDEFQMNILPQVKTTRRYRDRLSQIFELRRFFISELKSTIPTAMPERIDPTSKEGQQYLRDLALHGVEEMFEALQHLKNWKSHRQTDVGDGFDRDEFLEEISPQAGTIIFTDVDTHAVIDVCKDYNEPTNGVTNDQPLLGSKEI
jgi:hypothetical protein